MLLVELGVLLQAKEDVDSLERMWNEIDGDEIVK